MASISLRFVDLGWPVICPIISGITGHWSNHVDLMIGKDRMISALPSCVRAGDTSLVPAKRSELLTLDCTDEQRNEALSFAIDQVGKPYDYAGVLLFSFAPRWNDKRRWFCSELTAAALHRAGIITVPDKMWRVSPGSLYGLCRSANATSAALTPES